MTYLRINVHNGGNVRIEIGFIFGQCVKNNRDNKKTTMYSVNGLDTSMQKIWFWQLIQMATWPNIEGGGPHLTK